jgi:hypothetical protein
VIAAKSIIGLSEGAFIALAGVFVTGLFGVLVEFVRRDNKRTRQENHDQHAAGRETLEQVVGKLDVVHGDVIAVREDVAELREGVAVHEHRLNRIDKPVTVDWHEPYDDVTQHGEER